jgi:hypothetical protein
MNKIEDYGLETATLEVKSQQILMAIFFAFQTAKL